MLLLDAPIRDIESMGGICINTVARRVILTATTSILDTLREIQSEQIVISKHGHKSLADLMPQGIPVSGLFRSFLNFINLPSNQDLLANGASSTVGHVMSNRRPGGLDGCVLIIAFTAPPADLIIILGRIFHLCAHYIC
jgi:hypothetical protein